MKMIGLPYREHYIGFLTIYSYVIIHAVFYTYTVTMHLATESSLLLAIV